MAIQRISTAHSERLNPDQYWPQFDEDGYVEAANSQIQNARKAFQSGETMNVQATGVVLQTMEGATADAAVDRFRTDGAKLENRGGVHASNATINGLMAQNVANRKAQINFVLANHDAEVEAIKAEAVATGAPQFVMEQKVKEADENAQTQLQTIAQNSDQAHEELKGQLNAGEAPSVPSSMPGGPPGEGSPTLDGLDPEVQSSVGSAMGSGGGMDMSQMAGMAQGLLSPLTGALQSPPGADSLNQMGQQGFQMGQQALQQLLGQAGGGQAELTPEQVEELIAGQGGDSFDGNPEAKGGADLPPSGDGPKLENPEGVDGSGSSTSASVGSSGAAEATTASNSTSAGSGDATASAASSSSAAPSPAAEPVSAAPPQSAVHPTTELSGDSNAPASGSGAAGGTGGLGSGGLGPQQTASSSGGLGTGPVQGGESTGTQLSGSSAPTATSGSALGAPGGAGLGAPAAGMGAAAPMAGGAMGGAPMAGGMAPMMGSPVGAVGAPAAPTAGAVPAAAPLAPAGPTPTSAVPNAPQQAGAAPAATAPAPAGTPTVPASTAGSQAPNLGAAQHQNSSAQGTQPAVIGAVPVVSPDPANAGRLYHPEERFTVQQRAAGTILAAISKQFALAGITSPIAVALLEDGVKVYCTADGLGFIPSGAHLPADTLPLSEFPSAQTLFRADWTGCLRPGYVLKLASEVGIIPPVSTIIATDDIETEGVLKVTRNMLKGAPYIDCPITRDMFAKLEELGDAPSAMASLVQAWNFDPAEHDADEVALALADARWEVHGDESAVHALAHYMLMDAHTALISGQVSEAAYVLQQLLELPTV